MKPKCGCHNVLVALKIQVGLSENSVPTNPMVAHDLLDKIAVLGLYPAIFSQTRVPSERLFGVLS